MCLASFKIAKNLITLSTRPEDAGPILKSPPIDRLGLQWCLLRGSIATSDQTHPLSWLQDNMVVLSRPVTLSSELSIEKEYRAKISSKLPHSQESLEDSPGIFTVLTSSCPQWFVSTRSLCFLGPKPIKYSLDWA
jgi:hypothetical protein